MRSPVASATPGAAGATTVAGRPADEAPDETARKPDVTRPAAGAETADAEASHGGTEPAESHVRVDARALETALLELRRRVAAVPLLLTAPGVAEAKQERAKLLSQIDDYLLPRLRGSAAPLLVALVGSTGAGKSTLVNSLVGTQVSTTGVRRPTTNSPVLACHPDDIDWFAENNFLPTLPRVRQEGLARPGRDGLLVLAATPGMPRGLAVLDTPDIDSVVQEHHAFAYQFLDASDLWLLVTSAARYADAPVWQVLQHARNRRAALGVVLSRVPARSRQELVAHFTAMLAANGIDAADRFVIPETRLVDGMLPADVSEPIHEWLTEMASRQERRIAVLTRTMSGVLDTFDTRVPHLAEQAEAQLLLRSALRNAAEEAYRDALAAVEEAVRSGSLLRGEVRVRWQDFVVTGDLMRGPRSRRPPRQGRRARRRQAPQRSASLLAALRAALEALILSAAERAAEGAESRWRPVPAGAGLLEAAVWTAAVRKASLTSMADRTAEGPPEDVAAQEQQPADGRPGAAVSAASGPADASPAQHSGNAAGQQPDTDTAALGRSSPDLPARAARTVSAWLDHVTRLVAGAGPARRSLARRVSLDDESLSLVMVLVIFGAGATDTQPEDLLALPRRMLDDLLGEETVREIVATARAELTERVRLLFDEELLRFTEIIDDMGDWDEIAGVRLYAAGYLLGAVR